MLRMMSPQPQQTSALMTGYQQYNYPIGSSPQCNLQQGDNITHSGLNEDQTQDVRTFFKL